MKEIKLTQGKVTFVDDEDYEELNQYKWCAGKDPKNGAYRVTRSIVLQFKPKLKTKGVIMPRVILGTTDPKIHVDHIDGNTLNNIRANLRETTPTQNGANRRMSKANRSGYRGVCFRKKAGTDRYGNILPFPKKEWIAQININEKRTTIGSFSTAEEAAKAFDKAAKENYGEFCGKLNFE